MFGGSPYDRVPCRMLTRSMTNWVEDAADDCEANERVVAWRKQRENEIYAIPFSQIDKDVWARQLREAHQDLDEAQRWHQADRANFVQVFDAVVMAVTKPK